MAQGFWGELSRNFPLGVSLGMRSYERSEEQDLAERREQRLLEHQERLTKRQAGLDSLNTMLKIVDAPPELQGPLFDDFMQRGQQITGIAPNPETVAAMKGAMKKRQDDLRQTMRGMMEMAKGNPDALTEEMMMSIMGDRPLEAMEKFSKFYEMGQFNKAMQETEGGGIPEVPPMRQAEPQQPTPGPAGQRPSTSTPYVQDVMSEAVKQGVPPSLAATILRAENSGPTATSPKGAMGLMQLMPDTAKRYGVENPFDIQQNIRGGVAFIKDLYQKFGNKPDLIMAAYNAGEGAVQKHGGVPPFQETQAYVKRGMEMLGAQPSTARDIGISASERAQLAKIDNDIKKEEKILSVASRFSSQMANTKADNARQRLSQLRIDRDRIMEIPRAIEKERAIAPIRAQEEVEKAKQLTPVYADRAKAEAMATEDVRTRLAKAAREEIPVSKETTDKVDALMQVRSAISTIREILARRGQDAAFGSNLRKFTGPLEGMITQYLSQPFTGSDPDEDDFVTALRTLQTQEIRSQAGLAQTGTEVERAIGFTGGRLPVIFNRPEVFDSRIKRVEESTARALKGQARNLGGRSYGKFIEDYLSDQESARVGTKSADDVLLKALEERKQRGTGQ